MTRLIGEYECKLDEKGRFILPAALKKQIPAEAQDSFVINRGFEKCLIMYPQNEWEIVDAQVQKLNQFVSENRAFIRFFYNGATQMQLDSASRLNLPKRLLEHAGITKDLILFAHSNKIEVWAKDAYEAMLSTEPSDFSALAESVMGGLNSSTTTSTPQ